MKNHYWTFDSHIAQQNKTDGIRIMVSVIITHEFGDDFDLSAEDLEELLKNLSEKREGSR